MKKKKLYATHPQVLDDLGSKEDWMVAAVQAHRAQMQKATKNVHLLSEEDEIDSGDTRVPLEL